MTGIALQAIFAKGNKMTTMSKIRLRNNLPFILLLCYSLKIQGNDTDMGIITALFVTLNHLKMINFGFIEKIRWKYFAMELLETIGFDVKFSSEDWEDSQKDFLAVDTKSLLDRSPSYRWLVSCKQNNWSDKVVQESDELNLIERMQQLNADGFIGFYDTTPSEELRNHLNQLKNSQKIRDYKFVDAPFIEQTLLNRHDSDLLIRYFPYSYQKVKPIQLITSEYMPILCDQCGKDLLKGMFEKSQASLIAYVTKTNLNDSTETIHDIYCACKTPECDPTLEKQYKAKGFCTGWNDLSDFAIPTYYLRTLFTLANGIQSGEVKYTPHAYEKYRRILIALAQKVLRDESETDQRRFKELVSIESILGDII